MGNYCLFLLFMSVVLTRCKTLYHVFYVSIDARPVHKISCIVLVSWFLSVPLLTAISDLGMTILDPFIINPSIVLSLSRMLKNGFTFSSRSFRVDDRPSWMCCLTIWSALSLFVSSLIAGADSRYVKHVRQRSRIWNTLIFFKLEILFL